MIKIEIKVEKTNTGLQNRNRNQNIFFSVSSPAFYATFNIDIYIIIHYLNLIYTYIIIYIHKIIVLKSQIFISFKNSVTNNQNYSSFSSSKKKINKQTKTLKSKF